MRRPLIAGNWKMHCTAAQAQALASNLALRVVEITATEVILCPPFTSIASVAAILRNMPLLLGAQDVMWENEGAWTGEISPSMLVEFDCRYVIVGHSERRGRMADRDGLTSSLRAAFADNDDVVNKKLLAVLAAGMTPICCVGETQEERDAGRADEVVTDQVAQALRGIVSDEKHLVFAYEPVWAIGTGKTCPPEEASRVCGVLRSAVETALSAGSAEATRILYGGGVTGENAAQILCQHDIDGALLGGASLKADEFAAIVAAASSASSQ